MTSRDELSVSGGQRSAVFGSPSRFARLHDAPAIRNHVYEAPDQRVASNSWIMLISCRFLITSFGVELPACLRGLRWTCSIYRRISTNRHSRHTIVSLYVNPFHVLLLHRDLLHVNFSTAAIGSCPVQVPEHSRMKQPACHDNVDEYLTDADGCLYCPWVRDPSPASGDLDMLSR